MSQSRGSYNDKNNIAEQIKMVNNILPYYGIKNLADYDAELTCNSEIDLPQINDEYKEISQYFKISGLANPLTTNTQAITFLKSLCMQANVPFEWSKTQKGYTFTLSRPNHVLTNFVNSLSSFVPSLSKRVVKDISYFKNLKWVDILPVLGFGANRPKILEQYPEIYESLINENGCVREFNSPDGGVIIQSILHDSCVQYDYYDMPSPNCRLTYKIADKYYQIIHTFSRINDIIYSTELIFKNSEQKRPFDVIKSPYYMPNTVHTKWESFLPLYNIIYNQLHIVIELSEEEVSNKTRIECLIKHRAGLLINKIRGRYACKCEELESHKILYQTIEYYPHDVDNGLRHVLFPTFYTLDETKKWSFTLSRPVKYSLNGVMQVESTQIQKDMYTQCDLHDIGEEPIRITCE